MRLLLLQGPNLNTLGRRKPEVYGRATMKQIHDLVRSRASELDVELLIFQSNHEGALIDHLQEYLGRCDGIIINPAALTHYSIALRDALEAMSVPVVEVHISNIYAREEFRHMDVIAPITLGQIVGLGPGGYVAALELLVGHIREHSTSL